jgi:hypothetical protein
MKIPKNLGFEPVHPKNVLLASVVHGISCLLKFLRLPFPYTVIQNFVFPLRSIPEDNFYGSFECKNFTRNFGFSNRNYGFSNRNYGFSNQNFGFSNRNFGFSNRNFGFSNYNFAFSNRNFRFFEPKLQVFRTETSGFLNRNFVFLTRNFVFLKTEVSCF